MTGSVRMPHAQAVENLLVDHMRRDLTRPKWWNTLRGRLAIGGVGVLVVSTGIASVALLDSQPVSETMVVHCLDSASRNLDGTLSGKAVSIGTPNGVLPLTDAVSVCEQMWASGAFASEDPLNAAPGAGDVPERFTTCVTEDGTAAVAPGRFECSALGLSPYSD